MLQNIDEKHPYYELAKVFNDAFIQASYGKGSERHSYSVTENYKDQLICEMDRRLDGNACGPRYQAVKKIYESARMNPQKAVHELLGAINYIAAAIILLKEQTEEQSNLAAGKKEYIRSPRKVEPICVPSVWFDDKDKPTPNEEIIYCTSTNFVKENNQENAREESRSNN